MRKLDIAVIGSGIAGLSAAWLLSKNHNVHLFEKDEHIGGHTNTRTVDTDDGPIPVDTGFIVYNEENYPNLTALFACLDVETSPSNMSFSFSKNFGQYEYSGTGAAGVFGQKTNLFRLNHWRMLKDIQKFFAHANSKINDYPEAITLGEFLYLENYSKAFCDDHILPMASAIWSSPAADIQQFPARSFIDFYSNHGLLKFRNRSPWRTVTGGSQQYVKKILNSAAINVHLAKPVFRVRRLSDGVVLETGSEGKKFDQVVFACHGDIALRLIDEPTPEEASILGQFHYTDNHVVLHKDPRFMPRRRQLWSSWNYGIEKHSDQSMTSITYWMNKLQPLATQTELFVTVNPARDINPDDVFYETSCRHPIMDASATIAQRELWNLQGHSRSWFCGSYFGYGFHEDALQSGLAIAEELGGAMRPWNVANNSGRIHRKTTNLLQAAE